MNKPVKILVVEDDNDINKMLCELLSQNEYSPCRCILWNGSAHALDQWRLSSGSAGFNASWQIRRPCPV